MDKAEPPVRRVRYLWMQPGVRGYLALILGIPPAGNINVLSSVYTTLRSVPAGTTIRPWELGFWIGGVALFTALFGLPLGIVTMVRWRSEPVLRISGLAATLLSLTPLPAGHGFLLWYASSRGVGVLHY